MEKKLTLNINGFSVPVIIINAPYLARTSHYSYGQIYISCPIGINEKVLVKYLEKCYKPSILKKFDREELHTDSYCYVLGEKRRIVRPFCALKVQKEDIIVRNDEELKAKLKKLSYDLLLSRVRRFETIMQTKKHDVKVTSMYAARGKNYYKKNLLTFSSDLIHFSVELIDAIVIHELAHDFVQNHSKKFYEIVYNYCSDYDERIRKISYGVKK